MQKNYGKGGFLPHENKTGIFKDFLVKITEMGVFVKQLYENDIAAEVYAGPALFCCITQDGDIIYEDYNADQSRQLEQAALDTRTALDFCIEAPFRKQEQMEMVNLAGNVYFKVAESTEAVMLCRFSELFGYEFVTCSKAVSKHNRRPFYRETLFYDPLMAQHSFLQRSGFTSNEIEPAFSRQEYQILLECCTKCVLLDNDLDSGTESRITVIVQKLEAVLLQQSGITPRQFFIDERN